MRILGRLAMVGVVAAGLGLVGYGIARERYPELDLHAIAFGKAAQALGERTVRDISAMLPTEGTRVEVAVEVGPPKGSESSEPGIPYAAPVNESETDRVAGAAEAVEPAGALGAGEASDMGPIVGPPFVARARPSDAYDAARHDLSVLRMALAAQQRQGDHVVPAARTVLETYLPTLMHSWVGTGYDYSGTSERPLTGAVACGYYVSTVLEHGGFAVERVDLARQPSEQIVRTLVPDAAVIRFSNASRKTVVAGIRERGPGIYLVGLDTHAGFLVHARDSFEFCHATGRENLGVVCEEAISSPSFRSRYTVVGKLDDDRVIQAWLDEAPVPTAQKGGEDLISRLP